MLLYFGEFRIEANLAVFVVAAISCEAKISGNLLRFTDCFRSMGRLDNKLNGAADNFSPIRDLFSTKYRFLEKMQIYPGDRVNYRPRLQILQSELRSNSQILHSSRSLLRSFAYLKNI